MKRSSFALWEENANRFQLLCNTLGKGHSLGGKFPYLQTSFCFDPSLIQSPNKIAPKIDTLSVFYTVTETRSFNLQNVIHIDELTGLLCKSFYFLQQHFLVHTSDAQRHSGAFSNLFVMSVGMNVNISGFFGRVCTRFLLSERSFWLLIQSKENLDYFGFGCGRQRGNNVFQAFVMRLSRQDI